MRFEPILPPLRSGLDAGHRHSLFDHLVDVGLRHAPCRRKLGLRQPLTVPLGRKLCRDLRLSRRQRLPILQFLQDVLELGFAYLPLEIGCGLRRWGFFRHFSLWIRAQF